MHAFFLENAPQLPINGRSVFLFANIREGRSDDQKKDLRDRIKASIFTHAGVPLSEIIVDPPALQLKYIAWLIQVLRQISATGVPSSPCFTMNAFWASVNLDDFIVFAPLPAQGKYERKTLSINSRKIRFQSSTKPDVAGSKHGRYPLLLLF